MTQPRWKLLANLGDRDFSGVGGTLVYEDAGRHFLPEGEHYIPETGEVFRFPLERYQHHELGFLVPVDYEPKWPLPPTMYRPWFEGSLTAMAETFDTSEDEIKEMLVSDEPAVRAEAYDIIGRYHGFGNLDHEPQTIGEKEAKKRYKAVR